MAASNKNSHLTLEERQIIETGIRNGSKKTTIAETIGKEKSTIGKEIRERRELVSKCPLPLECSAYRKCAYDRNCKTDCPDYVPFVCKRRDRSPGACNGCADYRHCRFDKFRYSANKAHAEYRESLVCSRIGVNATRKEIRELGELIKPLLEKGQSVYVILQNHPEIKLCEKTLYNYIEDGVFQEAGISITCLDLKKQVRRKKTKKRKTGFSPRKDRSYLKGRKHTDYEAFMSEHPFASVVEMDTVYNNETTGPFIQTFKFLKYDLLFCVLQEKKDTAHMRDGILLLESILGNELFDKEVQVLLTDRGSEFTFADETEIRQDGTRRTRIYYCDPMASFQKGSIENVHIMLRDICPKGCDLYALGLDSQEKADRISSHINSYKKEKLNGKSSFQLLQFLSPETARKFFDYGLLSISPDDVTLKPYILKK